MNNRQPGARRTATVPIGPALLQEQHCPSSATPESLTPPSTTELALTPPTAVAAVAPTKAEGMVPIDAAALPGLDAKVARVRRRRS